ncbi:MAG: hypothetical protein NTU50_03330 [Actinobacteria bacterium]|nr:hypothetical protein [Actinomycetota bacterium]
MSSFKGAVSRVAQQQLLALESGDDVDLFNAVVDVCELILKYPAQAQRMSAAFTTQDGIVLRMPVVGRPPFKVFWTSKEPRIEAVFPHP